MGNHKRMAFHSKTTGNGARARARGVGAGMALLLGAALLGMGAPLAGAGTNSATWTLPQDQRGAEPERYVLVGTDGARVLGLPDSKGHAVLQVAGDTPLAVYPFRPGTPYLKVTIPGGVKVWVYGKYLRQSSRPGWVEVAGSFVNMRPKPRSTDSYPIGRLNHGDRLRFIQRQDPSKPMAEDWVQVYSPQNTKAYVLAAETRSLPAGANAKVLWDGAVGRALQGQPDVSVPARAAAKVTGAKPQEATARPAAKGPANKDLYNRLAATDQAMDSAFVATGTPDYMGLAARYNSLLAMGPDAPTKRLIEQRLERLAAHAELTAIRTEIEQSKVDREKQLEQMRENAERGQRGRDPLWGRFQTRGWVERQVKQGEVMYLVRFGSGFTAQIQCSSGRYELDLYEGYEVGVRGAAIRAAGGLPGSYPLIDIDRIEVLSARLRKR